MTGEEKALPDLFQAPLLNSDPGKDRRKTICMQQVSPTLRAVALNSNKNVIHSLAPPWHHRYSMRVNALQLR